jgi:hypothetical protein
MSQLSQGLFWTAVAPSKSILEGRRMWVLAHQVSQVGMEGRWTLDLLAEGHCVNWG